MQNDIKIRPKRLTFCPGCKMSLKMPDMPQFKVPAEPVKKDTKIVTLKAIRNAAGSEGALF